MRNVRMISYKVGILMTVFLILHTPLFLFTGCVDEDEYNNDARGNFEALWKIMDEHYCFFDEKGIDWNQAYLTYSKQINNSMNKDQLFEVLTNMIGELRDGHVNLYSPFDLGRNWSWHENYPSNFSDSLLNRYLGKDYKIASSLYYRTLSDNIGYLRYASFSSAMGAANLDNVLMELSPCRALIIDIRNNGGGELTNAEKLAARFTNEEILVGYMQHKTGTGHRDFSELEEQRLKPSNGLRWQKDVYILTNRQVFSAANEFVKYMMCCPNVKVIGDHTGGGGGLPFTSELPNGWAVRFSACPMFDRNHQSVEDGIDPDIRVDMSYYDFLNGEDTIIETARRMINDTHS